MRLIFRELTLRRLQHRLKRRRINARNHFARAHQLPLAKQHALQQAVDTRTRRSSRARGHRANRCNDHRYFADADLVDSGRNCGAATTACTRCAALRITSSARFIPASRVGLCTAISPPDTATKDRDCECDQPRADPAIFFFISESRFVLL